MFFETENEKRLNRNIRYITNITAFSYPHLHQEKTKNNEGSF